MAAVEFEAARIRAVTAEGVEHLAAQLGEHGWVVFAVDEEGLCMGTHTALDIGDRADRSPVVAQFFYRDMVAEPFPNVVCGHALADNIGIIRREVKKASGFDRFVVHQGDVADRRTEAGAEYAKSRMTLLLKPAKAAA